MLKKVKKYALVGSHVDKSLSPFIHKLILNELGIHASYSLISTTSINKDILNQLNALDGYNVTTPYKSQITNFLHTLSPLAKILRNVNTVKNLSKNVNFSVANFGETGSLKIYENSQINNIDSPELNLNGLGFNTDGFGFYKSFTDFTEGLDIKNALVIGTGGVAYTVIFVLLSCGIKVHVYSQKTQRIDEIIEYYNLLTKNINIDYMRNSFKDIYPTTTNMLLNERNNKEYTKEENIKFIGEVENMSKMTDNNSQYDCIIDCSLGINGKTLALLSNCVVKSQCVYDLHFSKNVLSEFCRQNNKPYTNGIPMLILQAINAQEIWQERKIFSSELYSLILNSLCRS